MVAAADVEHVKPDLAIAEWDSARTPNVAGVVMGMDLHESHEWALNSLYRSAYSLGHAERERSRYSRDQVHGKDPARELARLVERVARELGKEDAGREAREAIADGVADAVDGRQPRWQAGPSPG